MFTNDDNRHLGTYYCSTALKRTLEKYKLSKITVHGFHHAHCSLLFESGVSINKVKDKLGHSNVPTTMNI